MRPLVHERLGSVLFVRVEDLVRERKHGTADEEPSELSFPKEVIKRASFTFDCCVSGLLGIAENTCRCKSPPNLGADPCRHRLLGVRD